MTIINARNEEEVAKADAEPERRSENGKKTQSLKYGKCCAKTIENEFPSLKWKCEEQASSS